MSIVRVEMQDPNRIFSRWEDNKWAVSFGSSRERWFGNGREPVEHGLWYEPVRFLQHWAEWGSLDHLPAQPQARSALKSGLWQMLRSGQLREAAA